MQVLLAPVDGQQSRQPKGHPVLPRRQAGGVPPSDGRLRLRLRRQALHISKPSHLCPGLDDKHVGIPDQGADFKLRASSFTIAERAGRGIFMNPSPCFPSQPLLLSAWLQAWHVINIFVQIRFKHDPALIWVSLPPEPRRRNFGIASSRKQAWMG